MCGIYEKLEKHTVYMASNNNKHYIILQWIPCSWLSILYYSISQLFSYIKSIATSLFNQIVQSYLFTIPWCRHMIQVRTLHYLFETLSCNNMWAINFSYYRPLTLHELAILRINLLFTLFNPCACCTIYSYEICVGFMRNLKNTL